MTDLVWCDTKDIPNMILEHVAEGKELASRKDYTNARSRLVFKKNFEVRKDEVCTLCDKPLSEFDFKHNSVRTGGADAPKFYHGDCWEKKEKSR